MKECEMCGKEAMLEKVKIEDTLLNVCKKCSCLGMKIESLEQASIVKTASKLEISELVHNFAEKIKEARKSLGIDRNDLAQRIGVSSSLLSRIEKGFRPENKIVKKLERELKISLFYKDSIITTKMEKTPEVTLGDVVQLRLKAKS